MRRTLPLLLAARVVNRLGAFSLPFLTVIACTDFGASTAQAGLISAAFGVASIPSRLAGGRLADRLGRRRTIVLGLSGCAATQLGIASAGSLTTAAVFAVLLGLCYELYEPPSQAMIAEAVEPDERARAFSLFNAALAAGGMGAGLIAAGLGRWDLRWLFVVDAASCLACALVLLCFLPQDEPRRSARRAAGGSADASTSTSTDTCAGTSRSGGGGRCSGGTQADASSDGSPWRERALLTMLASGTVYALVYLQIMMLLPVALQHRGLRPSDAGILFTVSAATIIGAQPILRLKRLSTLPLPRSLALGYLLLGIGLIGYAVSDDQAVAIVSTAVWSLGDLIFMGRAYGHVATLAPDGSSGRYLAVYGTSWGIAGITAPVLGTQVIEHAGVAVLWSGLAVVSLTLAAGHMFANTWHSPLARVRTLSDTAQYRA
jgi:MFS family permease